VPSLDFSKPNILRKSFSIIEGDRYKEKKDLIAVAYCHILSIQRKDITLSDLIQLIKNAKENLGGEVPEYMNEIFEIIKIRVKKILPKNIWNIIKNFRLEGKYKNALLLLEKLLIDQNPEALHIFDQMIRNREGFENRGTMKLYCYIHSQLHKKFGDKYDFILPFKISYI
jgi:hypothetical protein